MAAIADAAARRIGYCDVVEATLADVLRRGMRDLIEPRIENPQRALRVLDCLVETMTGFAIGTVAGDVFGGVRTWFGDDGLVALRRQLGSWPHACRDATPIELTYLEDAAQRPLVNELANKLHVRFCRVSRDVRDLITAIEAERLPVADAMFGLLATEENLERRLLAELTFGWSMFMAAIARRPFPSRENRTARSQALWLSWEHQLGGRPVLTRSEQEQAGYITLVA